MSEPVNPSPKRRRLWPRFTLRVLLLAVTAVCIGLGIWTQRSRRQRELVEQIQAVSGYVTYDFRGDPFEDSPRSHVPDWLLDSFGPDYFHEVTAVVLHGRSVLTELHRFQHLERLQVQSDSLTDAELACLVQLRQLRELSINVPEVDGKAQLGDRCLGYLSELPNLRKATIESVHVTAKGLRTLMRSPSLQMLHVTCDEAALDDDAVEALRRKGNIKSFRIGWQSHDRWYQIVGWGWPKH